MPLGIADCSAEQRHLPGDGVHDWQRDAGQRHLPIREADLPLHSHVKRQALQHRAVEDYPLASHARVDLDRVVWKSGAAGVEFGVRQALAHVFERKDLRQGTHAGNTTVAGAQLCALAAYGFE